MEKAAPIYYPNAQSNLQKNREKECGGPWLSAVQRETSKEKKFYVSRLFYR